METKTNYNVVTTATTGSPEWKEAHKGRIGGSMVANILGYGRSTPLRAWAELTEKIEPEDISNLPFIRRGVRLEPVVKELYQDETGRVVLPSPGMIAHASMPWLAGTPDGVLDLEGSLIPWEAKTFGFFKKADWAQGSVPVNYQIQVQLYMILMGAERGVIAAMPVDDDENSPAVLHQDLALNPIFADWMMDTLVEFREKHWLTDIPPPGNWEKDRETIKRMFPKESEGRTVEMTDGIIELWHRKEALATQKGIVSKELDAVTAEIEAFMGDAEFAIGPGFRLRYKVEPRKAYMVEASSPRVMRKVKA